MYLTDEAMDEYAEWLASSEPPEDAVSEADYHAAERAEDERIANCPHEDTGIEPLTNDPNGPMGYVCYECKTTLGRGSGA